MKLTDEELKHIRKIAPTGHDAVRNLDKLLSHIEAIAAEFKAQHAYDNEVIADNGRMIQLLLEQVKRMEAELSEVN